MDSRISLHVTMLKRDKHLYYIEFMKIDIVGTQAGSLMPLITAVELYNPNP